MQRKRHINFKFWKVVESSTSATKVQKPYLHSIPTLSSSLDLQDDNDLMKNKLKPNVLYSIPCGCAFALLLVGTLSIMPDLLSNILGLGIGIGARANHNSAYAAEQTFGDSTASLTLDTSNVEVKVAPGSAGYVSKNIGLSINNVNDYALTITAPATLSKEDSTNTDIGNSSANTATSWGYAYGQSGNVESMSYTNFTGNTQTLESSNSSITNINTNKTLAIEAKFNDDTESGHYKANIILALTATPKVATTYTLSYDANGAGASNLPDSEPCTAYDNDTCNIIISNTTPTRTSYKFLGWADSGSATAKQYSPGDTITMSENKTIYAVWQSSGANWSDGTSSGVTYMQDITTGTSTSSFCSSSLPTHASITLKDRRDESSYTIAKMADGKCWMAQNLKIADRTITSADSDVSSSFTIPASSASGFSNSTAVNAYILNNTSYYTWCAATAGTAGNCKDASGNVLNPSTSISPEQNATSSICPKGWKLPLGGSSLSTSDFGQFLSAENISDSANGSTKIQGLPYNFAYTGRMENGSFGNQTQGYWWTSTAYGVNDGARLLIISSSSVYAGVSSKSRIVAPGSDYGRWFGYAIRCIAK